MDNKGLKNSGDKKEIKGDNFQIKSLRIKKSPLTKGKSLPIEGGRPPGDNSFINRLERITSKVLKNQKPGPKTKEIRKKKEN